MLLEIEEIKGIIIMFIIRLVVSVDLEVMFSLMFLFMLWMNGVMVRVVKKLQIMVGILVRIFSNGLVMVCILVWVYLVR